MDETADGQYLPAEWAPQQAVVLTWPHARRVWGDALPGVEATFVALAREIARREALVIACHDSALCARVRALLARAGLDSSRLALFVVPNDDIWVRDHGPLTVYRDGRRCLLDLRFDGWGGKHSYALDNAVTQRLWRQGAFGPIACDAVELVLEGGSIEVDGAGTLLTTASCLLDATRNPGLVQTALESRLKALLGVHTIHWLHHGRLIGDDTDGHIDTLARFAERDTIIYQGCADPHDPHYEPLSRMADELHGLRNPQGRAYSLRALPLPSPVHAPDGERLPAGYANFLVINGAVLMPTYADPADERAARVLGECFPERAVVGIDARPLIRQYGGVHCATMQIPSP